MSIIVGSVGVSVVPDATGFSDRLRPELEEQADRLGESFGRTFGDRLADQMVRAGDEAAKRFSESFKGRLDAEPPPVIRVRVQTEGGAGGEGDNPLSSIGGLTLLGSTAIPLAATATEGVAALGAAFGAAGVGAGALAAVAIPTLKSISSDAGPAGQALNALSGEYKGLVAELRPEVLGVATNALHEASQLLPLVAPAAKAGADGIERALVDVQSFTPAIKSVVGDFTSFSSTAIPELSHAFVGSAVSGGQIFAALLPLAEHVLPQIDAGVDGLLTKTENLGSSNGFQHFILYVEEEGPKVVHTLEDVVGAGAHIVSALAPIGSVVVSGIGALAEVIEHIPTGVLTGVAVGLGAVYVAAKALTAVKGAKSFFNDALGGSTALAGGLGLAATGLSVVGALFVTEAQKTAEARQAAQDYLATLSQVDSTNLTNSSTFVAGYDEQKTKLEALIALNNQLKNQPTIGQQLPTAGNASARSQVTALTGLTDFTEIKAAAGGAQGALDKLNASQAQTSGTITALGREYHITADQAFALAQSNTVDVTHGLKSASAAFGPLVASQRQAVSTGGQLAADQAKIASTASTAADKATALSDALNLLNGNSIDAEKAQDDLNIAIPKLASSLAAGTRTLVGNTTAASTNREALLGLFQQAEAVAAAQVKSGTSVSAATANYQTNYNALIATAQAAHLNSAQVQALIKQYHLVPSQVKTAITGDTGPANKAVQTFGQQLPGHLRTAGSNGGAAFGQGLEIGIKAEDAGAAVTAATLGLAATAALNRHLGGVAAGAAFGQGVQIGIKAEEAGVAITAAALGIAATAALNHNLGVRSPSTVGAQIGSYFGQGFALGVTGTNHLVMSAAAGLGTAATTAVVSKLSGLAPKMQVGAVGSLGAVFSRPGVATQVMAPPARTHSALLAQQNALLAQQNALLAGLPSATGQHTAAALNGVARKSALTGRATPGGVRR